MTDGKKPQLEEQVQLIDVLKLVSPGTLLRTAIDDILRAEMGALIVVDSPGLADLVEEGFKINCKLTSQRIVELAKMDGAIILSSQIDKILQSNALLVPDTRIPTNETGTRHKAAERTAKQAETLVIAVSERRKKVTVYHGNIKYVMQNPEELLSRATQTLQILEKQREIFDDLMSNLNVLEISGLVVLGDVCLVLQRTEMIMKTAKMIDRYLIELGKEGVIIRMRLRELLRGVDKEKELIFKDYGVSEEKQSFLADFSFDELLNTENLCSIFFSMSSENKIHAKGYRILGKTSLQSSFIIKLIERFENLDNILNSNKEELEEMLGNYAEDFQKEISSLKEQIMMARKI